MFTLVQQKRTHQQRITRGFSLVELLVSLSVFSIVMTISIGTLLIMIDANAKAQALSQATTNLSFALDNITREIRTGYHYYCSTNTNIDDLEDIQDQTHDCASNTPGSFISFMREKDGVQIAYRLQNGVIEGNIDDSGWFPLTSDQITIDTFDIVALGTDPYEEYSGGYNVIGDTNQATVDIYIKGSISNGLDTATSFNIQSHMTEHRLDTI